MRYGAGFPTGNWHDFAALRDFAQALDEAGIDYVSLATHVVSFPPGSIPDENPFHYAGPFRDPFTLFAYLAGVTRRIRFRTAIAILPLYNTFLVAKQAADLSLLSGGRFELGVSISWNRMEYEAMGQDHAARGKRLEEQVTVLKKLWSEPFITFSGRWHRFENAGLNQLPPPIPVLIGTGNEDRLLRRVARLGDGWLPLWDPVDHLPKLRRYLQEAGRDPNGFPVSGRIWAGRGGPKDWVAEAKRLQAAGVTDLGIGAGFDKAGKEALSLVLEARRAIAEEIG